MRRIASVLTVLMLGAVIWGAAPASAQSKATSN